MPGPIQPTRPPSNARRWAMRLLRIGFSVGLLSWLVWSIGWEKLVESFRLLGDADPWWLAFMLVLMGFGRFLNGIRWYILLKGVEPRVGYGQVMRIFLMSSFLGQFMPGVVGMEAIRVVALGRSISNPALAFASVLVDRLLGFFSLVTVVLVAIWFNPVHLPASVQYGAAIGLVCLIIGSLSLASPRMRAVVDALMPGPIRRKVSPKLHKIYACLDAYRRTPRRVLLVLLLSLLAQGQHVAEVLTMARALHITHVPWQAFFVFVPIIFFAVMLPFSVSGLGVREAGYVTLFGTVGMTAAEAFALSLCMMIVVRIASLPGLYFVAIARKKVADTIHEAQALPPSVPPEDPPLTNATSDKPSTAPPVVV